MFAAIRGAWPNSGSANHKPDLRRLTCFSLRFVHRDATHLACSGSTSMRGRIAKVPRMSGKVWVLGK
jgi:hypothetical protein